MIRKIKPNRKRSFSVIMALTLTSIIALLSVFSYFHISGSLYRERMNDSGRLMEKIAQNVETGMRSEWNLVHYIAGEVSDWDYSSMNDARSKLSDCEKRMETSEQTLLFVDGSGLCHASDGTSFRWEKLSMLLSDSKEVYVSTLGAMEKNDPQLFFLEKLPREITIEGINMTHICLVCDMKTFDTFFDTKDYGSQSAAFVIHSNGVQVYRQEKENSLSSVYNVISALEHSRFRYGGSVEKLEEDINNGVGNCMLTDYNGSTYFVDYYPLSINDWTAVLLIPEEYVGDDTAVFTRHIVLTIVLMATAVLIILVTAILVNSRRLHRKQAEINRQLHSAAIAERKANEAKTRFLSSMSHDIRTPMNAIIGMTAIAERHIDEPGHIKDCLGKISLASNHLLTLINDILDISKVESGKMALNPAVFSLADTIMNLVNIVRTNIAKKNLSFKMRIHNIEHEYIFADELRINQVFINLLTNAVKYTPEGKSITVDLHQEIIPGDENSIRLTYIVEDTGIGMTPEFQAVMYDSFSRATDSRIDKIQGSGLGLSICRQMTELMGGTIFCDSKVNEGTVFTVTFDVPTADNAPKMPMLPPIRVLIADDDELFLDSAAASFRAMGAEADTVLDSENVLDNIIEKISENEYKAVIISWELSAVSSIELVSSLKARLSEDPPFILISSYDWTEIEEEAREAGADGFINKPLFRSAIYTRMNELLHFDKHTSCGDSADDLAGINLLIAEDNDLNWEIIQETLELYGITSERAENGKICVDMINSAEEGKYAMILMDIQMPVMNGRDATREIRTSGIEWVRNIPIIAMTADAFAEDIQECFEAGMNDHIAKPLDINKLFAAIRKAGFDGE